MLLALGFRLLLALTLVLGAGVADLAATLDTGGGHIGATQMGTYCW